MMKQWKRLIFYLSLNFLVSACATFAILLAWDRMYTPLPKGLIPEAFGRLYGAAPPTELSSGATGGIPGTPAPAPTEAFIAHQVKSGETFETIAKTYNVSVEELVAVNGFTQEEPLGAGELLRIPLNPQGTVVIDSVIGAGDLETERVLLKHRGEGELTLTGWRLEDNNDNVYIFPKSPQLTLFGGGAVHVYSRTGIDTVIDLFWGLDQAVWYPGAKVILRDAQGNVRDTYEVP